MVTLANICLSPAKADAEAADRIITAMEDAGLAVPPGLYSGLAAALGGRKRTRESVLGRSGHEVAAVEWEGESPRRSVCVYVCVWRAGKGGGGGGGGGGDDFRGQVMRGAGEQQRGGGGWARGACVAVTAWLHACLG